MRKYLRAASVALILATGTTGGLAQTLSVEDVVRRNLDTTKGFVDSREQMTMTITRANGQQVIRRMTSRSLEVVGDGNKTLIIFQDPADVKGAGVLTHSHITGNDDQWIYLPAVRRVKRISSANKSGPFMGSEFAYEDLSSNEFAKYTYADVGQKQADGRNHYLVERRPAYDRSGYSRQIVWIDDQDFLIRRIDMYDRSDRLYKTQTLGGYKQFLPGFWRALKIDVKNHKTGKGTTLEWSGDIRFKNGFRDRDFSKNALKR